MDYAPRHSKSSQAPTLTPISIPSQARQQSQRTSIQDPSLHAESPRNDDGSRVALPPASPEVISSLITSLSVISKPANTLFDHPSLSVPALPSPGSFGVDYGAYSSPSLNQFNDDDLPLDQLPAAPPTIRTAKPPSGLSPLTVPKSPKSPKREGSAGGLRSLLRSSRPSSRGSVASNDDTRSIGNLSIERGLPPTPTTPELRGQRSHDSWGRKSGRNQKGLMYMSSKERLRTSEEHRKRASGEGQERSSSSRPDPFLAETPITEETYAESPCKETIPEHSLFMDSNNNFQRSIPARDSSLRKTGPIAKSSAHRSSRPKRGSELGFSDSIPETDEYDRISGIYGSTRRYPDRHDSLGPPNRAENILRSEMSSSAKASTSVTRQSQDSNSNRVDQKRVIHDDGFDDGAPFPSVSSGRRRSAVSTERGKSGQPSPENGDTSKSKRSNSKPKRLSIQSKNTTYEDGRSTTPEPNVAYERPRSADSIDDEVESYLRSPRLSQQIRHPQTGRIISFSEVGDPDGSAVFCCVGMGLTRYIMAFYDELALTLKLRLVTPDRPGVGDSEAYTDGTATPLSWPDDVYAICQSLKITKFSILAHSAGAIYALATALRMPQHIRGRIHLLAPWIPPSQMNVFGTSQATPPTNAIPTSQRILRALPTPFLKAANSSFMSATSSSITSSLPKSKDVRRNKRKSTSTMAARDKTRDITPIDKENLANIYGGHGDKHVPPIPAEHMDQIRPSSASHFKNYENDIFEAAADAIADKERQVTYDNRLTYAIWDLATTGANPAVDLLVCLERRHTIGFRYVDITRPVVIHHGSKDTRVPVENVKWLGKTMRRCEVRILEGEAHGLMASATVMGNVLMEISKEWEDWSRLTGSMKRDNERERGRSIRAAGR